MKKRILVWSCLAFFAAACHNGGHDMLNGGSEGETAQVSLILRNDIREHEMLLTRAVSQPEEGDFLVRLENTRAEVLREWRYDTMPSVVRVVPGSYKLVAYYGDGGNLPAFDAPYYYGETKASLKRGDNLDTVIYTSVATVKVALRFDESFDFDYDDYFVEVKTVGDSLHFAKDEKREGYFLPGNLRMRFGLKPKGQEKYYEFYPEAIRNVKAAEFYRMTLRAQSENGALSKISIITDTATIHIPVNVELPSFMLPKAAPKVAFNGEVAEDGKLVVLEGEKKSVMAVIASAGGLTGLKIKADGAAQEQGWPAELDLMNADASALNILREKGVEWDERITTESGIKSMVWVRFDNAIPQLMTSALQVAHSGLSVCATDRFGQETESKVDLEIHPVLFAELPTEADIWARRAEMKLKTNGAEETYIEYKSAAGDWQRATMEEIGRGAAMADYWVKNLNPGQEYVFRACVGEYKSIQELPFTTEEAAQVPNAGMEDWYNTAGGTKYWEVWYACREGEVPAWNTMNQLTTSEGGSSTTGTGDNRNGCRYNANSGTLETSDCHHGGKAALIRTVGWGKGNTAAVFGGMGTCKHVTPGELYLGDYDVSAHTPVYGRTFRSRPSRVAFWYKYAPKNASDWFEVEVVLKDASGNVLASKKITKSGAVSTYQQESIALVYEKMTKAASMSLLFKSSGNSDCWGANKDNLTTPPAMNLTDGEYVGSQLYIDDIELIYE